MTISNLNVKAQAAGNLVTTAFPFTFKTYAKGDLQVTLTNTSGANSVLVLDTDYTVALNADQNASPGGTVTYLTYLSTGLPLPVGAQLTLLSNLADLQGTNLPNGNAFFGPTVTDMADVRTILSHQKQEAIDRSIKYPVNDPALGATIPSATVRAGLNLGFDALGNLTVQATAVGAVVSGVMIPVVAAASLVNARTLLGAGDFQADGSVVMTGSLQMGTATAVVFEGATADAFETTLNAVDPTADRTILLPNSDGTLVVGQTLQAQTFVSFTTGGTSTAYTLTPTPAITANATNQRFRVAFHTTAGATPTLAVSGQTAKNLKYKDSAGAKQAVSTTQIPASWVADVEYDGTDWVVLNVASAAASGVLTIEVLTGSGNWTVPAGVTKVKVTVVAGGGSGSQKFVGLGGADAGGTGGGGGGTAIAVCTGLTPGNAVAYVVGAASASSSFSAPGGTVSATAGAAGLGTAFITGTSDVYGGGAGGVGSGGSLNLYGTHGGTSDAASISSNGGNSVYGAGGKGKFQTNQFETSASGIGLTGKVPGGGGGGSGGGGALNPAGGAGAAGTIILEY